MLAPGRTITPIVVSMKAAGCEGQRPLANGEMEGLPQVVLHRECPKDRASWVCNVERRLGPGLREDVTEKIVSRQLQ